MSNPGDPGRRLEFVEGPVEAIVSRAVELVGTVPGARSFELAYDAATRTLAEDEEPGPDEAVVWTASAELRRRYTPGAPKVTRTLVGQAVTSASVDHAEAIVEAVVDLLEQLGANVVLLTGGPE